jgi:hypothetical protein
MFWVRVTFLQDANPSHAGSAFGSRIVSSAAGRQSLLVIGMDASEDGVIAS